VWQDKALLSPREVRQITGLGRTKVNEMLQQGTIPSFKLGRLRRIPVDGLRNFIQKQLVAGASDQVER
jgi:excisionase family DNA binding protein